MNLTHFMKQAITLAKTIEAGEIPIAALIIKDNEIIAQGTNTRQKTHHISGHAEINALQQAAQKLNSWHLHDCTLVVTLEPCLMCAGAILQSQLKQVVFGAYDLKNGALGSKLDVTQIKLNYHLPTIYGGICEAECQKLLTDYFQQKRTIKKG